MVSGALGRVRKFRIGFRHVGGAVSDLGFAYAHAPGHVFWFSRVKSRRSRKWEVSDPPGVQLRTKGKSETEGRDRESRNPARSYRVLSSPIGNHSRGLRFEYRTRSSAMCLGTGRKGVSGGAGKGLGADERSGREIGRSESDSYLIRNLAAASNQRA